MDAKQFKQALNRAHQANFTPIGYFSDQLTYLNGCALDKIRRPVTLDIAASIIVHHCYTFAGTWDYKELQEVKAWAKRWDLIESEVDNGKN